MSASTQLSVVAPQFDAADDRAAFLVNAATQTNAAFYGANSDLAIALRAAHELTMRADAQAGGGSGQIASKKEGDLAISYHKGSDVGNDNLGATTYGIWLRGLRSGSGPAIAVTGGNDDGA